MVLMLALIISIKQFGINTMEERFVCFTCHRSRFHVVPGQSPWNVEACYFSSLDSVHNVSTILCLAV